MIVSPSTEATGKIGTDRAERFLAGHPSLVMLGRVGWVAKGVVYALVGLLALSIALNSEASGPGEQQSGGSAGSEASQSGAIARIAEASFGATILGVVGAGLLVYAVWRAITALLPADNGARAWATRIGYVISAVVYTALAWSALSFVSNRSAGGQTSGDASDSEDARVERFTREVMSHVGGRWLVAVGGVVLIAIGLYFARKGTKTPFEDQLAGRGAGPLSHHHIVMLGRIGWVGRGLMTALIGTFLIRAALNYDPEEAEGLDGALRRTVDSGVGAVFVAVVAFGLIVYGVYCVASAPQRRLASADE
jgi:hypothetical protein